MHLRGIFTIFYLTSVITLQGKDLKIRKFAASSPEKRAADSASKG